MNQPINDKVILEEELFIEHKITTDHKMDRPHFHDGFEIHFTLADKTNYFINGKKYLMNAGTVALIHSSEIHKVDVEPLISYERYYLLFRPSVVTHVAERYPQILRLFINRPSDFENCIQLNRDSQLIFIELLNEMVEIYTQKSRDYYSLRVEMKLVEMLIFLDDQFKQERDYSRNIQNEALLDIVEYIKSNLSEEITLDDLSKKFYKSKSTIIRMFKNNLGMTPNQFIIYTRISESRNWLLKGYSVREVAYKVGYSDESSFIKKFKSIKGISPKQYVLGSERKNEK